MLKIECNEKRPRFETEPLEDGRTLVRLYISIHALLAESDCTKGMDRSQATKFLSTLLLNLILSDR